MKIGIEGQRLFRKKKHGMDRVALELIQNLQEMDHENEYYIFVRPGEDPCALRETKNFKIVLLEGHSYPVWEQYVLPRAAKKYGCQVLHCTSNTAPYDLDIPIVTTLHDIIYLERSYLSTLSGTASFYQKFGNVYRKLIVPRIVKKSRKIITVSNFEKKRISSFFGINGDGGLQAVYNGVSKHFKPVSNKIDLDSVKTKYQLPDHFFLFMGSKDPRKNTRNTIKAFSEFKRQMNSKHKLVMLNYDKRQLHKSLVEIDHLNLLNNIVLVGYVDDQDLPAIYSMSEIFLFPSLREGFGIPIIEAMACGAPVITSNTSSMPEIANDAAHIVDPTCASEIAHGILKIISDEDYKNELIDKGFERCKQFSWNKMARQVLEIYKQLYKEIKE